MTAHPPTAIVILAGGRASRMGGIDKCRLPIGGATILHRTLAVLRPQSPDLALSANGDPTRFADLALPILTDTVPGHQGPLAGILAGLDWAATLGLHWLISTPADCPFLPPDLALRLHQGRGARPYACAASGTRTHPAIALWPTGCRAALRDALLAGHRKVAAFTAGASADIA